MSKTLAQLQHDIYLLLNETNATALGELESGVDATPTESALLAADQYIDQVVAFLCRNLPFIEGWARYTNLPVGTSRILLHDAGLQGAQGRSVMADGSILTGVRDAYWNGNKLTYCSLDALRLQYSDAERPQNGTPLYWYMAGNWVGIYPSPNALQPLELYGWVLPPSITTGTQSASYVTDDRARPITVGAAALLARDNIDDKSIAARVEPLAGEFDAFCASFWDGVPTATRKAWYRSLPFLLGGDKPNRLIGGMK